MFSCGTDGSVRLVGGASDSEGRVEVYYNGAWGTVCDDNWDITDANVVCQQLNYTRATSALGEAYFGAGSGPIHYDDVVCTGTETRLADCAHNGVGIHNCGHSEDAGVQCNSIPGQCTIHARKIHLVRLAIGIYFCVNLVSLICTICLLNV